MKANYWRQKAAPWVSAAVLAGGLTSSCILFFLVKIQNGLQGLDTRVDTIEETLNLNR